jgi:two-component system, sensor histidine kinase RegB
MRPAPIRSITHAMLGFRAWKQNRAAARAADAGEPAPKSAPAATAPQDRSLAGGLASPRLPGRAQRSLLNTEELPAARGAVRVRTLLYLRWIGVFGQSLAIYVTEVLLHLETPLLPCLLVIAASAVANLHLLRNRPSSAWLGRGMATLHLAFDVAQVSALLYLTGGLHNPFAMIIIVPVTISATILPLRSTMALGMLAIGAVTLLAFLFRPLPWPDTLGLTLPRLYLGGVWVALVTTVLFVGGYAWRVAAEARSMANALTATKMALAREQRLSAVGGIAAAAAHELGSPLSTIAVVTKELLRDVPLDSPLRDDIELLQSEANRCREILAGLTDAPERKSESPLDLTPVTVLLTELAEAAETLATEVEMVISPDCSGDEPTLPRSPELVHGFSNFINNATQFARSRVAVTVLWDAEDLAILIEDDGPGFPAAVLDRLGEPYISTREGESGHMGLGVFIATTLLFHTGATVEFGNGERRDPDGPSQRSDPDSPSQPSDPDTPQELGGARVLIAWERDRLSGDLAWGGKSWGAAPLPPLSTPLAE